MSDPAIEAAQRTSRAYCRGQIPAEPSANTGFPGVDEIAEFAAREALKPIRELHKPVVHDDEHTSERWAECGECLGAYWPCATAELIYTTEELAR